MEIALCLDLSRAKEKLKLAKTEEEVKKATEQKKECEKTLNNYLKGLQNERN